MPSPQRDPQKRELLTVVIARTLLWEIPWDLITDDSWLVKILSLVLIPILWLIFPLLAYVGLVIDLLLLAVTAGDVIEEQIGEQYHAIEREHAPAETPNSTTSTALRCAFCHDVLQPHEVTHTCDGCGSKRHVVCVAESEDCPTLGCARSQRARARS